MPNPHDDSQRAADNNAEPSPSSQSPKKPAAKKPAEKKTAKKAQAQQKPTKAPHKSTESTPATSSTISAVSAIPESTDSVSLEPVPSQSVSSKRKHRSPLAWIALAAIIAFLLLRARRRRTPTRDQ